MTLHFNALIKRIQSVTPLPLLPDEAIPGIRCEDHLTFAVPKVGATEFIEFWRNNHFQLAMKQNLWETTRYPAQHIGLTMDGDVSACADMIGLSVPLVEESPLTRMFELYGNSFICETDRGPIKVPGVPQHVAYCLASDRSMVDAISKITDHGFDFITPLLEYTDHNGAVLRQAFFGCKLPYGPFAELIQRVPAESGEPFRGFSPSQIDDLYQHYSAYSERLLTNR